MALKFNVPLLGLWVFLNSVIDLGFIFQEIGFEKIYFQYAGKKDVSRYFGTFLFIKVLLLALNIALSLSIISFLGLWGNSYTILFLCLIFSKTLFQFGHIFITNFRSKLKIFKAEIPLIFSYFSKSILKIYVALNVENFLEPLVLIAACFIMFDVCYLIFIVLFSRNEIRINRVDVPLLKTYLKDAKSLILLSIVTVIASNLGNLLLDFSFGHDTLSYFSLVYVYLIPSLLMLSDSLVNVYLTHFSQDFERNDMGAIKEKIYLIEKYSSILFLGVILVVFLYGRFLFILLLPKYVFSLPILYVIIFVPFIIGTTKPYEYLLISGKQQGKFSQINILTQFLIIISLFNSLLFNYLVKNELVLNTMAYALAQTLPWLLWAFLVRLNCRKLFTIKLQKNIFIHLGLGVFTFAVSFFFKEWISRILMGRLFISNIMSMCQMLALFFGLLCFSGQLDKGDLQFFLELFRLKSYFISIRAEFSAKDKGE